jgi:plasmid maintenance system antidote protein VapI
VLRSRPTREEFLKPLEVSQYQLAKEISVPARRSAAS